MRDREKEQAFDAFLVASARAGDSQKFASLVERWDPKLRAHAWRLLGDAEQVSDVVQEAWTEIVRNLARLNEERAFAVWAYRIVTRRCAKAIARFEQQRRMNAALAAEAHDAASPADVGGRDAVRLRSAVQTLPPGQRAAVALYYFEELSVAETAVALDVPVGTVKTRLLHARRALRAMFEGDEECAISTS